MKIRCLPVPDQAACLACSKVNRDCVFPGPAKKRQKTVHKVAELEKKINALTDALVNQQAQHANPTPPTDSPSTDRQGSLSNPNSNTVSDAQRDLERLHRYDRDLVEKPEVTFEKGDLDWGCTQFHRIIAAGQYEPYRDIIDRKLIDMSTATAIFDHYVINMAPHFPVLAFPHTIFAEDVRTARPMLFLAILAIAAPGVAPQLHSGLVIELTRQLSERIMFLGEKSLEMVQAILVYTSCYSRGKYAKDLSFNQLIHSAVVMCLDLGIGKRYKRIDRDAVEEAEIRRTWLMCYYFANNVSILLRHPTLVHWGPYTEECVEFFQSGKDTTDKDKWLCAMVHTQHMAEEISTVFNMDDPKSNVSFADTSTQYHLKALETQLAAWHSTVPSSVDKNIVSHMASSLNLYLHEIAIHHDHNVDDFKPGDADMAATRYGDRPHSTSHNSTPTSTGASYVTTRHISALSACLDSCHTILDSYLALPLDTARNIPNLGIVWNTYAAVALIKLHGVLHAPESRFAVVFTPDLRVEWYLDSLIERLEQVSADGKCPPAEAFVFVVRKLKTWFKHRKAGGEGTTQIQESEVLANINEAQQEQIRSEKKSTKPQQQQQQSQQPSQPVIGTSSMPASQIDPSARDLASVDDFSGGFPSSSWNAIFPGGASSNLKSSQAENNFGFSNNAENTVATTSAPLNMTTGMTPGIGNNATPGMGMTPQYPIMGDLNVAYNAQNYNINWEELQFGGEEMRVFDDIMTDRGWMGYLI